MRPLTEDESKLVFEKLANYIASTPLNSPLLPSYLYSPSEGEKHRTSGGQAGRCTLFSVAQGSRLLCL